MLKGVYRMAGAPEGSWSRVMAASLYADGRAPIRGDAAAWVFGLKERAAPKNVALAWRAGSGTGAAWLEIVRSVVAPQDQVRRAGVLVTSIERTIVDLAATDSTKQLELAIDDALRQKLTVVERLAAVAHRCSGRGFKNTGVLAELLSERALWRGKVVGSPLELGLLRFLSRQRFPMPLLQHPFVDRSGKWVGNVDFAYPDLKVALEADGIYFHSMRRDRRHDDYRDGVLEAEGWTVLRVTWSDLEQPMALIRRLTSAGLRQVL